MNITVINYLPRGGVVGPPYMFAIIIIIEINK